MASGLIVIGDALGARFGGDPLKACDAAGVIVRVRKLGGVALMAYARPTPGAPRAVVVIASSASAIEREWFTALALGHHLLRHRRRLTYSWTRSGPLLAEGKDREADEAEAFAEAVLAHSVRYTLTAS